MTDLISRSAVHIVINSRVFDTEYPSEFDELERLIDEIPAIDAVLVVHAMWIRDDSGNTRCSNCHTRLPFRHCYDDEDDYEWDDEIDETLWCMHCGARMDAESEEDTDGQTD